MAYKTTEVEKYNLAKSVWEWLKKEHQNDQYEGFSDFDAFFQDVIDIEMTGEHTNAEDDNSKEIIIVRVAGKEIFTGFNFLKEKISGEKDSVAQPDAPSPRENEDPAEPTGQFPPDEKSK